MTGQKIHLRKSAPGTPNVPCRKCQGIPFKHVLLNFLILHSFIQSFCHPFILWNLWVYVLVPGPDAGSQGPGGRGGHETVVAESPPLCSDLEVCMNQ